jgi:hypothetical protein
MSVRRRSLKEILMRVRLFVENTKAGLKATVREQDDAGVSSSTRTFRVASMEQAKRRASTVARGLGLSSYSFIDRTHKP